MAFYHHAHQIAFARFDLLGHIAATSILQFVFLTAVGMATVHHQLGGHTHFAQFCHRALYRLAVIIGVFAATAQNHVTIGIARGAHNRRMAAFGHRQKVMRIAGCADGINGDFHVAIGTVLKPTGQDRPEANSR